MNEILPAGAGKHFRHDLRSKEAVTFIERRQEVQFAAIAHGTGPIRDDELGTRADSIEDAELPAELDVLLSAREIAEQHRATLSRLTAAQGWRTATTEAGEAKTGRVMDERVAWDTRPCVPRMNPVPTPASPPSH